MEEIECRSVVGSLSRCWRSRSSWSPAAATMTTTAAAAAVVAAARPIKVGASLPLTGEFSEPGKAAQQGYKVWEAIVNEKGGLIDGRNVEMVIKDDALEPEHDRRRLQRADQPGQGRPAARHVLVAAQPAGLGGGRAQPDALRRARRRRARAVRPRLQVPVLRPAGHGRQAGRGLGELADHRAARERAARRRRPTRRSTTRSRSRPPRASRRSSRRPASRPSTARPTRSTTRTSTRSRTR